MIAGRAYLGGLFANDDMAAVAALPHLDFAFSKDLRHFHIVQQGAVALLMMPFNGGNHAWVLAKPFPFFQLPECVPRSNNN